MITRQHLASYLKGQGIEIGAYHFPFPVQPNVKVTYVDKFPYEKLRKMCDEDPNLGPHKPIVKVDIVDDGETLEKIPDNSQDFVISSHQLEHCKSPLTAIENHLRVLKPGGHIVYAVPDKRFTFDKERANSNMDDLRYLQHVFPLKPDDLIPLYNDYLEHVDKISDPVKRSKIAMQYILENRDVHFHVWDCDSLLEMFLEVRLNREIELFSRAGHENFVVVKKI